MQPIHATTISIDGKGVLIRGATGSGKSTLAVELIGLGAELVADDRTIVKKVGDELIASCPETIRGRIEIRKMGVLKAPFVSAAPVNLVIDLDCEETERMPPMRTTSIAGVDVTLLFKFSGSAFAPSIRHYIRYGLGREI